MKFRCALFMASAAGLALSMTAVSANAPAPYSGIVVFGTSLSDSGNAFALRGSSATPPDYMLDPLLIPGAPYARGGHHFANGATWIEQLGRSMGLAASVRPAFASDGVKATNYAVGGARAYDDGKNVNLSDQVAAFLADHDGVAAPDALYVIEMGGNDLRDAIVAYQAGGFPAAQLVLEQALTSIAGNIQLLYQAGARHFLVWLPVNVGLTPAIQQLNRLSPGVAQLATLLTQGLNAGLTALLSQLSALPGITITTLDAYSLLNNIVSNPGSFGLANATDTCVTPNQPPFFCQTPDDYLFWDGIHPTRAAHTLTAQEAARALGR